MSVPSNLIPTRVSELPEYAGGDQSGFVPYLFGGRTYKLQLSGVGGFSILGVPNGATDMGTYTGTIIPDYGTVKANIQVLETATEQRVTYTGLADASGASLVGAADGTVQESLNARVRLADLAAATSLSSGSALVGYKSPLTGSVARTSKAKHDDTISAKDFGAKGDGVTDDTAAFTALETVRTDCDIDLLGASYYVSAIPSGNRYFNGSWVLPSGNSRPRWNGASLTGAGRVAFGDGALEDLPISYSTGTNGAVIAIGYQAMANATAMKQGIAIGSDAMSQGTVSRDNIAIGTSALRSVQGTTADYDQSQLTGTRNIAIGGNAGRFITTGYNNTHIGRNGGQCNVSSVGMVSVGAAAAAGYGPIGLSGEIENWAAMPSGTNQAVAVGLSALSAGISSYSVAVGGRALLNNKKSNGNVAIGPDAYCNIDAGTWYNGGTYSELSLSGTYSQSGTTLTLNITAHTLSVGDTVILRLLDGGAQTFQTDQVPAIVATVPSADQFTIVSPLSLTASGTAQLYGKATAAQAALNGENTALGGLAGFNMLTGVNNVALGYRSTYDATSASNSVAVGFRALTGLTNAQACTAIGTDALRFMVSGSVASGTGTNRIGIGNNTRVSGNDQVQIGDSSTTTYVFGTVQNRSDARDKADIRDTALGLDFINALRPVDYRWDMRDDYFEKDEEGNLVPLPKDGSKKRSRFHHGLIAQEVKATCDALGVDFGGYQDHAVNGGDDVLTVGYDELIGPLIRAVQEIAAKQAAIEARLAALESN